MTPRPAQPRFPAWAGFLLVEIVLGLWLYRDALWGGALLAPLDCAPTLLSKYRFVEPAAGGVPANHHLIDQLTYDLPLHYTIYHAYRRGEIPWWDPFTYGGRPLLADAHINGTDPVRLLCYALLPFEPAYNWTRIAHWFLTGLGMFCLLRHWQVRGAAAVLLAAAYQCAGFFALCFGHPWVQGSLVYYPWLWMAWEAAARGAGRGWFAVAALLVAAVFCTGNIQSHSYLVLFAGAFLLGYAGRDWAAWRRLLPLVAASGLLGAMLAAPVLVQQLEFFAQNVRPVKSEFSLAGCLGGVASFTAAYPWLLGTFRTLDLSKLIVSLGGGLGFHLFIGSVAVVLAFLGAGRRPMASERQPVWRMALWLLAIYFVILSTPLAGFFYVRVAGLAVLALTVLAAFGVERLWADPAAWRRAGATLVVLTVVLAVVTHLAAFLIYPRFLPEVRQIVQDPAWRYRALDEAAELRQFQIANLPNEVSFKNPELALGSVGFLALAAVCLRPTWRRRRGTLPLLLVLNLLPEIIFYGRFLPHGSLALWERLRAGGPEQQRLMELMQDKLVRLYEKAPGMHEMVMPHAFPHFYRVREVNGYSSLHPRSLYSLAPAERERLRDQLADYIYESRTRGLPAGELRTNTLPGTAVFQWATPSARSLKAEFVSLTELRLTVGDGPPATLLWTDTHYPGWRALANGRTLPLKPAPPCFSHIEVPGGAQTITLRYAPRFFPLGGAVAALGLVALVGVLRVPRRNSARTAPPP